MADRVLLFVTTAVDWQVSLEHVVISAADLAPRLVGASAPVLIDVRLPEDHAAGKLPGAAGNCVFEVAFVDRMPELAAKDRPVCVYGEDAESLESRVAAEKLARQGYREVLDFRGGLAAWREAGFEVESSVAAPETPEAHDGTYPLDLAESRVLWTGRNLLNRHDGTLKLKSGEVEIAGGTLAGGSFVFDMRGMACTDLAGDPLHEVLIAHLLSDDFFEVEKYPEASFKIIAASLVDDASPGSADTKIRGVLHLKGIDGEIEFLATTGITPDGKLAAQASFEIDRTRWNVIYGSGKFFRSLGGHLVNDRIGIQLRIVTQAT